MKRTVSGVLMSILLLSMLCSVFKIMPVQASGTIYIRADGSIDPPSAPIQRMGDKYTLTSNIVGGIVVQRSDIVIDGCGYTIVGGASVGVNIDHADDVTIKNARVQYSWNGIEIGGSNNIVTGNYVANNDEGIGIAWGQYNTISENIIVSNNYGIRSGDDAPSHNNIVENYIAYNNFGVYCWVSQWYVFYHNSFVENTQQAGFWYTPGNFNQLDENYWSDYTGVDSDHDGFGDTPYIVNPGNVDHRPLMNPRTVPDDLSIVSLEPIQVVEDASALIKDKNTAIRVDIKSTFTQSKWIKIYVNYDFFHGHYLEFGKYRNGIEIKPGLNRVYLPGGPIFDKQGDNWVERKFQDGTTWWTPRDYDGKSLGDNFFFRWTTQTGVDDNIQVSLDLGDKTDTIEANNAKTVTPGKKVAESDSLKILFVPIHFYWIGGSDPQFDRTNLNGKIQKWSEYLLANYPTSDVSGSTTWPPSEHLLPPTFNYWPASWRHEWLFQCIQQDLELVKSWGYDRVVYLIKDLGRFYSDPNVIGEAIGMLRSPEAREPIVIDPDYDGDTNYVDNWLLPHEVGHTFYLWHPFNPELGPEVWDAQLDWVAKRKYETNLVTLMSYGGRDSFYHRGAELWIDQGRYDGDLKEWTTAGTWRWNLYDQFRIGEDPEIIVISGLIFDNSSAQFSGPAYRIQGGIPDISSQDSGNYSIVLSDSQHSEIGRFWFNATFSFMIDEMGNLTRYDTDTVPFVLKIPYVNGTALIEIQNSSGYIFASRAVTLNSPSVSITYPNGGETFGAGRHTISWTASDPDGDNLAYTLAYSPNNGVSWVPLALNLDQTSYAWDTSYLEAGSQYVIKVIASDGINTGEDISDGTFSVDPRPPIITVVSPQAQTYYSDSVPVSLSVNEDLSVSSIWYSLDSQSNVTLEENGFIDAADGAHQIIFYANDTVGNVGSSSVIIFYVNSSIYYPWQTNFVGSGGYPITDLVEYDGDLYAARDNILYRFDGSSWTSIDAPTNALSLDCYDGMLYIGGKGGLYAFDGSDFYLVFGVPNYIKILGTYHNTLYAGTVLDKPPILYCCSDDASNPDDWCIDTNFSAALNFTGPFGSIDSFAVYNDIMYLGSGGSLCSFDGTSWSIVETFEDIYAFSSMEVYNGKLYVATRDQGWRKPAYEGYSGFNGRVFEFDGSNWTELFEHDYWIFSLEVYDGKLYAGTANKIYTFDGTNWTISFDAKQEGFYAIAMSVYNGKIYAGIGNAYIFADPDPIEAGSEMASIPEFSSATILAVLMVLTLFAVALSKKNGIRKFG